MLTTTREVEAPSEVQPSGRQARCCTRQPATCKARLSCGTPQVLWLRARVVLDPEWSSYEALNVVAFHGACLAGAGHWHDVIVHAAHRASNTCA